MTSDQEHRTQLRMSCRIPMEYNIRRSSKSYDATVYNISDTGLYVETDRELRPGQDIRIHIHQDVPEEYIHTTLSDQTGIIRWILPMTSGRHHIYGAGIRLSSPGLKKDVQGLPETQYFCDVCGEQVSYRQIRKYGVIWLCPRCSEYVTHLPVAVYRATSRHLIGNVI